MTAARSPGSPLNSGSLVSPGRLNAMGLSPGSPGSDGRPGSGSIGGGGYGGSGNESGTTTPGFGYGGGLGMSPADADPMAKGRRRPRNPLLAQETARSQTARDKESAANLSKLRGLGYDDNAKVLRIQGPPPSTRHLFPPHHSNQ